MIVVSIPDPIDQFLARFQVAWLCAPVKFVLQPVLNVQFQVLRNVVTMSNVADTSHRHWAHELVSKRRQLGFE